MYDGEKAVVVMIKSLKEGIEIDKDLYKCTVIEYQKETEQVHLLMETGEMKNILLDAIYECRIDTMKGEVHCIGKIKERYGNHAGNILVLQVLNGFYEKNMK